VSRVVAVNPSLVVERVGSDYLMLTASGAEVVRATGDAADVITCAISGQPLPQHLHTAADVLQGHGVLTTTTTVANTFTPSRRHALQLGAAAAAVGLTMLALPNAAAAASVVPPTYTFTGVSAAYCTSFDSGGGDNFIYEIELKESGTFTLTSETLIADIILVGGGGSGSNPRSVGLIGGGGGGGGGGGEVDGPIVTTVFGGTAYPITVGAGGADVTGPPGAGIDGGSTTAFEITVQGGKGGDGRSGGASGQPFSGGDGSGSELEGNGGGGGGAGGVGGDGEAGSGGSSGAGYSYDGVTALLAEGGGGGGSPGAGSGSAGGGTGGRPATPGIPELLATAGETNTGSGGGGGYAGNGSGAGGSGIVIVRFSDACGPLL